MYQIKGSELIASLLHYTGSIHTSEVFDHKERHRLADMIVDDLRERVEGIIEEAGEEQPKGQMPTIEERLKTLIEKYERLERRLATAETNAEKLAIAVDCLETMGQIGSAWDWHKILVKKALDAITALDDREAKEAKKCEK